MTVSVGTSRQTTRGLIKEFEDFYTKGMITFFFKAVTLAAMHMSCLSYYIVNFQKTGL